MKQTTRINHEAAGDMVRKFRLSRKVSLRAVAIEIEMSAPYLSDLERGRRNWSPELFVFVGEAIKKLSQLNAKKP